MSGHQAQVADLVMDLVCTPGARAAFEAAPEAFAAARGLGLADQAAFARSARRLGVYRDLVRAALLDPLPDCFPVTQSLLEGEDLWEPLLDRFLEARAIRSIYYRDIQATFVTWLAETRPLGDDRPYLLALAHYEYMELEILRWPDTPMPEGLSPAPGPQSIAHFDGTFRALSYDWQVHRANPAHPLPQEGPTHLACHRSPEGDFMVRSVTPQASAFLARALQGERLGSATQAAGLSWPEAEALLGALQSEGALQGYR